MKLRRTKMVQFFGPRSMGFVVANFILFLTVKNFEYRLSFGQVTTN